MLNPISPLSWANPQMEGGEGAAAAQLKEDLNPSAATDFSHTTLTGSLSPWEPFLVPV